MSETEPGPCLWCRRRRLSPVRAYRSKSAAGRLVFGNARLYECRECRLVQVRPLPTPERLFDYYQVDYRRELLMGADVSDADSFPHDNLFYFNRGQSIAELIAPHVETDRPRVLDVGAGFGHILHSLAQRFPQARRLAIEFSAVCVEHLQSLGVEVASEPADQLLAELDEQFDVVVMSHLVEHLADPRQVLELVRDHLAPGGLLYIEVPNIPADSLLRYPDHVWAPRFDEPHITFFSLPVLTDLLESIGLEVVLGDTAGPRYKYISKLRHKTPTMRFFVQQLIPKPLFDFLRRQRFTAPLRVPERVDSFFEYGGPARIWLRTLSRLATSRERT